MLFSKKTNEEPMDLIVENIIKQADLGNLPEQEQKAIKEQLKLQIDRRIGLIIMDNLSDDGITKYAELVKDAPVPDPEKLQKFLESEVPNYQEKIKDGLDKFIVEILGALKKK